MISFVLLCSSILYKAVTSPPTVLAALICFPALEQWGQLHSSLLLDNSYVMNVAVAALVSLALFQSRRRRPSQGFDNRVLIMTSLLVAYAFLSSVWSPASEIAFERWMQYGPALVVGILMVPFVFRTLKDFEEAQKFTLLIGTALCVLFLVFAEFDWSRTVTVGQSQVRMPLGLAQVGGFTFVLAILLIRVTDIRWQIVRLVGACAGFLLVLETKTRGQFFFMLAAALVFYSLQKLSRKSLAAGLAGGLLLLGIGTFIGASSLDALEEQSGRFGQEQMEKSWSGRMYLFSTALGHWYSDPSTIVFGLGNSASFDPEVLGVYSHNLPIDILTEEGLIGLCLFVVILIITIRRYFREMVLLRLQPDKLASLCMLCGILFFAFLSSLKEGSLLGVHNLMMLAVLMERHWNLYQREFRRTRPVSATNYSLR